MGKESIADHKGQQKCSECKKFAENPVVGHFKCAAHRACTSSHEWQPYNCDMCLFFKRSISQQPAEEKNSSLNELVNMLQDMSTEFSGSGTKWEYEDTFYSFMDLARPETRPSQSEMPEGEIPEHSGELSGTETNTGRQLNKTPYELPSTNELLVKMMGSIQELTGKLCSKASNKKSRKMKSKRRSRRSHRSPSTQSDDSTSEESGDSSAETMRRKRKSDNSNSRKRPRSPSPVSDDSSDKDSEYSSDTDHHSNSSDSSHSPPKRSQPRSKRRGGKEFF